MDKEDAKVLLVTSVMENEGKSTVAANLALSLAQGGSRVMLIDCDFRKPAQYKIFNVRDNEEKDLGDVLINHASTEKIIRNWNNSGLYMILNKTSSNAIETLLKSMTLKQIIAFCREKNGLCSYRHFSACACGRYGGAGTDDRCFCAGSKTGYGIDEGH